MSWVMASFSSEHVAVAAQRASVVAEDTPGVARTETPRKSDSPDARADIRRRAKEAAAARMASVARKKTFATATKKMVPDKPAKTAVVPDQIAKSALVNGPRLAVARERIPGMARKKHGNSSASLGERSSSSNGPSVAASFSTG